MQLYVCAVSAGIPAPFHRKSTHTSVAREVTVATVVVVEVRCCVEVCFPDDLIPPASNRTESQTEP